jgi:hypothetical protein
VEPLADVEVNVPGVMAILVAPVVAQLRVLLRPEVTAVGSALKEAIVGAEVFPGDEGPGDEVEPPQSASPKQANRIKASGQRSGREEWGARGPSLLLESQLWESMRMLSMLLATRNCNQFSLLAGPWQL